MTTRKEAIEIADRLAIMASRRKNHVALTWKYGNEMLTLIEKHAEVISRAVRLHAAEFDSDKDQL
jgi:hypothetical protein